MRKRPIQGYCSCERDGLANGHVRLVPHTRQRAPIRRGGLLDDFRLSCRRRAPYTGTTSRFAALDECRGQQSLASENLRWRILRRSWFAGHAMSFQRNGRRRAACRCLGKTRSATTSNGQRVGFSAWNSRESSLQIPTESEKRHSQSFLKILEKCAYSMRVA